MLKIKSEKDVGTSTLALCSVLERLTTQPDLAEIYEFNLAFFRRRWGRERRGFAPRVIVCGSELSNNAAGRVRCLADLWQPLAETAIIGAIFPGLRDSLGPPNPGVQHSCHSIHVTDEADFARQALALVQAQPCDLLHLSNPRMPDILFGLFYKLVWDARVVLDIDDGDAARTEPPLKLETLLARQGGVGYGRPVLRGLCDRDWTRVAVGFWDIFDGTTVFNRAAQMRGGANVQMSFAAGQETARLSELLASPRPLPAPNILLERPDQQRLFQQLGGWQMFARSSVPAPAYATLAPTPAPDASATAVSCEQSRLIVYSVLTNDYETPKTPTARDSSARYILFTDKPDRSAPGWEVIALDTLGLSPRRASRLPKLLPHRYLPDHDISLYIDASLTITETDVAGLAATALQGADVAGYSHFERDCVYDEIEECIALGKADTKKSKALLDRLMKEQFPRHWGLLENAFLLRRNSPVMRRINELWFKEYIEGPERDQFSLMCVLWRAEVPHAVLDNATNFRKSPHVGWTKHKKPASYTNHPLPKEVIRLFGFLADSEPTVLSTRCEEAISEIASRTEYDGLPNFTSSSIRQVIDAIENLNMLGKQELASNYHFAVAKALFPETSPFSSHRPFKLAYIANSPIPSIAANNVHVMKMCGALAKIDVNVILYSEKASDYTGTAQNIHSMFSTPNNFEIVLEDIDKRGRHHLLYRLLRRALEDGCTHVYTRSIDLAVLSVLADVPTIFEDHRIRHDISSQRFLARNPSLEQIVVISQPLLNHYSSLHRNFQKLVTILHDAADPIVTKLPAFNLGAANRPGSNVGYVGHLYPGKGAELCLELAQRMPNVSFHMLGGSSDDLSFWRNKAADVPNLVFYGHLPPAEVPSFIATIDICIAPFLRKVIVSGGKHDIAKVFSPLKIFEYMAHGKPIVSSDLPVLKEVLTHNKTALICNPDRPESFVEALEELIADPLLGRRLGRAAKARLEADFTWTARAREIREFLESARPRIDPPPAATARPAPAEGEKPLMRWYYGGEKHEGWAYEINARRLSSRILSLDHIAPGALQQTARKPDIALAFDLLIMTTQEFQKENRNKKVILRVGGPNPLKIFSGGNRTLLRKAVAQADALIVLSPQQRNDLQDIHPSVHFIPNGIDIADSRPEIRRRVPGGHFRVGMVASMSNELRRHTKGYYFAKDACAAAGVELMVIGRGTQQIPHDRLLTEFWSQIDVLLHPVDAGKEGSSNVIMEALAWGVPVITTRYAGFHGVSLVHGREGLIVNRTVADFAGAIRALRDDPALRETLSRGGRTFVERHHDLDTVARQYEYLIWNCLKTQSHELKLTRSKTLRQKSGGEIAKTSSFWKRLSKGDVTRTELVSSFFSVSMQKAEIPKISVDIALRAAQFGYFSWPLKLRKYIHGKRILDIGCGNGMHGIGFVTLGAASYCGADPKLNLDKDEVKNKNKPKIKGVTQKEPLGWTPKQISEAFGGRVKFFQGTTEEIDPAERTCKFDVITLHTVTEHLMDLQTVFAECRTLVKDNGYLIYLHDNFYSWKGHHMYPRNIQDLDPTDSDHMQYADWNHLTFEPPPGHYFTYGLNKIRLDELRVITEHDFEIKTWNESMKDSGRLTNEILTRHSGYTRHELLVGTVFCIARPKLGLI